MDECERTKRQTNQWQDEFHNLWVTLSYLYPTSPVLLQRMCLCTFMNACAYRLVILCTIKINKNKNKWPAQNTRKSLCCSLWSSFRQIPRSLPVIWSIRSCCSCNNARSRWMRAQHYCISKKPQKQAVLQASSALQSRIPRIARIIRTWIRATAEVDCNYRH